MNSTVQKASRIRVGLTLLKPQNDCDGDVIEQSPPDVKFKDISMTFHKLSRKPLSPSSFLVCLMSLNLKRAVKHLPQRMCE